MYALFPAIGSFSLLGFAFVEQAAEKEGAAARRGHALRAVPDARALITVDADPKNASALAAGDWSWDDAPDSWNRSLRELAVVMVADWPGLGLAT